MSARLSLLLAAAALALAAGPRSTSRRTGPSTPPVDSPGAIPDAPLSGTLRGATFVASDARYVADHRVGYQHVDIKLSAGSAEAACGEIKPAGSPSVWLRLERSDKVSTQELRLEPGQGSPWSVHYQVREDDGWVGSSDAAVVGVAPRVERRRGDLGLARRLLRRRRRELRLRLVRGPPLPLHDRRPRARRAPASEPIPEKYAPKVRAP